MGLLKIKAGGVVVPLRGSKGAQGDPGPQGPKGDTGPTGPMRPFASGSFTADGTNNRILNLGFTPSHVRFFRISASDIFDVFPGTAGNNGMQSNATSFGSISASGGPFIVSNGVNLGSNGGSTVCVNWSNGLVYYVAFA